MTEASRAERVGRRVGLAVFGIVVVVFCTVSSVQILRQVFWPEIASEAAACRPGIVRLSDALDRARKSASAVQGERAAIDAFRRGLEPEWAQLSGIRSQCASDPEALKTLEKVKVLRFAEERHVRLQAIGLAPKRRAAAASVERLRTK